MKRLFVVSLTLCALAYAWLWWSESPAPSFSLSAREPAQASAQSTESGSHHVGSLAVRPLAHAPKALRYAVEFHNEFMPTHAGEAGLLLGFSAVLTISPVEVAPDGRWAQLVLSNLAPLVDSEARNFLEGPERAHLVEGLSQPFYLGVGADGRAEKLKLTRPSDPLIEGILRLVAEATQFVVRPSETYQIEELDPVGEALTRYRALGDQRYEKRKLKYLRLLTPEGLATPAQAGLEITVEGETRVKRNASNSHTLELALSEDVRTKLGDATLENHVELGLRLIEALSREPALLAFRVDRQRPEIDLSRLPAVAPIDRERALRERLAGRSMADLLREARSSSSRSTPEKRDLVAVLEASLVLEPQGASALANSFRKAEDAEASLLLSALASAGTPAAQRELASIATDRGVDEGRRESALAVLGMTDEPSRETVEVMREASRDTRHPNHRTSTLALGNLAGRMGEGDEKDKLFDELVERLKSAQSEDELMLCLGALGNTGDARLSSVLRGFIERKSPRVRGEALWALRLVNDREAFALLAHGASADPESLVRQRAIEALRYRAHPEGTKVLARAASHDPDPEVRLSALVALSSRDDPSLRELVRTIAANDPSPVVREQAARMLEG